MATVRIGNKAVAMVDDDWHRSLSVYSWQTSAKGYAMRRIKVDGKERNVYMHREIVGLSIDDPRCVDHIDGDKLNNRRGNLRICTPYNNMQNRGTQRNNKSGFKGVSLNPKSHKWEVKIGANGVRRHLGFYDDPAEGFEVYCLAADMLHGEFANHGTKEVCHAE